MSVDFVGQSGISIIRRRHSRRLTKLTIKGTLVGRRIETRLKIDRATEGLARFEPNRLHDRVSSSAESFDSSTNLGLATEKNATPIAIQVAFLIRVPADLGP